MADRHLLHRIAGGIVAAQDWIAAAALMAMMLVVVGDIAQRNLFGHPLRGSYDLVSFSLLVMVFFGIGRVILKGGEIAIDLVDPLVGPRGVRVLTVCAAVLSVAVISFSAWAMAGPARDAYRYGDRSLELGLPIWTLWVAAFVGMGGNLIAAVLKVLAAVAGREDA